MLSKKVENEKEVRVFRLYGLKFNSGAVQISGARQQRQGIHVAIVTNCISAQIHSYTFTAVSIAGTSGICQTSSTSMVGTYHVVRSSVSKTVQRTSSTKASNPPMTPEPCMSQQSVLPQRGDPDGLACLSATYRHKIPLNSLKRTLNSSTPSGRRK